MKSSARQITASPSIRIDRALIVLAASTIAGKASPPRVNKRTRAPSPAHHEPIAVMFDFVKPIRPGRNFGAARRDAWLRTQFYAWL
jgi:hypothetical protein